MDMSNYGPSALAAISNAQGVDPTTTQPVMAPTAPTAQPNWLERLLPTAGAIGGGLLGTLAGPVGSIGGGAAGSALGQQLENDLTGTKGSTLVSGLEGGVGQGIGLGIGKLLQGGAGVLGGLAEKQVAGQGMADFASQFPKEAVTNNAMANLDALGSKAYLDNLGIAPTANNFAAVSKAGNATFGDLRDEVLDKAGPIDLSNFQPTVDQALTERAGVLGGGSAGTAGGPSIAFAKGSPGSSLQGEIRDILQQTGFEGEGSLNQETDAKSALSMVQQLQNVAASAKPKMDINTGVLDPVASARYQVLNQAAQTAKSALYDNPNVIAALKGVSNYDVAPESLVADSGGRLSLTDANKLAPHLNDIINNADHPQQILDEMSQLTDMGKLGRPAIAFQEGVAPFRPGTAAEIPGVVPQSVQDAATALHPKLGMMGRIVGAASKVAVKPAAAVAEAASPYAIPGGTILGQLGAHAPGLGAAPVSGGMISQGTNAMNPYQTTGVANPNIMGEITQAGILDPAAVPALQGALKAQQAQPMLQGLENQFGAAGGAQGAGGGFLSQLSSYIPGTAAYQYHQQEAALATAIAQATGMSPQSVLALLPSLMANQQGAQGAFGQLQGSLNAAVPNAGLQGAFGSISASPSVLSAL